MSRLLLGDNVRALVDVFDRGSRLASKGDELVVRDCDGHEDGCYVSQIGPQSWFYVKRTQVEKIGNATEVSAAPQLIAVRATWADGYSELVEIKEMPAAWETPPPMLLYLYAGPPPPAKVSAPGSDRG